MPVGPMGSAAAATFGSLDAVLHRVLGAEDEAYVSPYHQEAAAALAACVSGHRVLGAENEAYTSLYHQEAAAALAPCGSGHRP